MTDRVVAGLVKRRAEITGEIERTHERLRQILTHLKSLDAALQMFAPDMPIESIKSRACRPPADWSNRGQMTHVAPSICDKLPSH